MVEIDKARPIVKRALDLGVNFFDVANLYSNGRSEEIVGELLKDHRDDVVIATKVRLKVGEGPNKEGLSRHHILQQVRESLKRLQTDRIDLYQIHRWDYATPIEETLLALNDLIRQETVGYIGASSMWAWQFAKALFISDHFGIARFVSMQNHYNLCYREEEREMIPLCKDQGIGLIPWSPLARGFLTGRYKRGKTPSTSRYKTDKYFAERFFRSEDFDVVERAEEIAKEKGATAAQIALAWLLAQGRERPDHWCHQGSASGGSGRFTSDSTLRRRYEAAGRAVQDTQDSRTLMTGFGDITSRTYRRRGAGPQHLLRA